MFCALFRINDSQKSVRDGGAHASRSIVVLFGAADSIYSSKYPKKKMEAVLLTLPRFSSLQVIDCNVNCSGVLCGKGTSSGGGGCEGRLCAA